MFMLDELLRQRFLFFSRLKIIGSVFLFGIWKEWFGVKFLRFVVICFCLMFFEIDVLEDVNLFVVQKLCSVVFIGFVRLILMFLGCRIFVIFVSVLLEFMVQIKLFILLLVCFQILGLVVLICVWWLVMLLNWFVQIVLFGLVLVSFFVRWLEQCIQLLGFL